ncbi:hypothetical protein [Abyssogena phaseoliformis symbiont]|uniref:hypothetical protein n=1 Tax=Abyssogena phaseoliformis symbiont TaxID=596095 RepID=UPI001915A34F|nr:hypothetical protein [Abyssogena phaseoliformis symbiont]
MVAAAMELKRIGVSKKSLLVVPNHIVDDFAKAFFSLYLKSDILVPPQGGLSKQNRISFFERACMLNIDAIIIGHSAFKFLQVSAQTQQEVYTSMIEDMDNALFKMNNIKGLDKRVISQQIQQKERLEKKLEDILSNVGDKDYEASTIENIGIDSILVDEAHLFKNLGLPTSMSRIAGLGSTSQMAMDLFLKIQYFNKINGRVVFATGTLISNSMAELYTMQRYLSLDSLK